MVYARFVKKGEKRYVVFTCEHCGKDNYFHFDVFKSAYKISDGFLHCKYCGMKNEVMLDSNVSAKIYRRKKNVKRKNE